ncbi:hypothetical protein ScPMuIL_018075 [Solemya velum]
MECRGRYRKERQQECDKLLCYSDPGGGLESPEVESSDAEPTQSMVMESDASKTRHVGVGVGVLGSEHSTASNQSTTPHKQPTVEIHHPLKLDAKSSQDFEKLKSSPKKKFLKVAVTVMFIMIAVGVIVIWTFHGTLGENTVAKYFAFNEKSLVLTVWSMMDDVVSLEGRVGGDSFLREETDEPVECIIKSESPDRFHIQCDNEASLTLSKIDYNEFVCLNISWFNISPREVAPMDCYELKYGRWYGMLNKVSKIWPVSGLSLPLSPYMPGYNNVISNIVDYYWLSSRAVSIYVPNNVPLAVSWNSTESLCFSVETFLLDDKRESVDYSYALCQAMDMKISHEAAREHLLPFNESIIRGSILQNPFVWVSGIEGVQSNITKLREFIFNIGQSGLGCSAFLDLGMKWEMEYGDLHINPKFVADIDSLILQLEAMQCELVFEISPLCSYRSPCFTYGIENDMFVNDISTGASKLVNWKGQEAAVWDLTNPAAVSYIKGKLQNLTHNHRVSAFKLSPFHGLILVNGYNNSVNMFNQISKWWTDILDSLAKFVLLQEPFRSQDNSVIIELNTVEEKKDGEICHSSILPTALTTALYGYPYFAVELPDMSVMDGHNRESFIRWLQVSIFLPTLKLPEYVLQFDRKVLKYIEDMLIVRNALMKEIMNEKSLVFSNIRPLWWLDHTDAYAQSVDDQFMLGEKYLIAPVTCTGQTSRDIYFPAGEWMTPDGTEEFKGKQWVRDYPAPLFTLPYFKLKPEVHNEF